MIDKKIALLNGKDVWSTVEVEELKLPSIVMADGPHGLRKQIDFQDNLGINEAFKASLFPSAATLACTFNNELAYETGKAIGNEARSKDVQIVLGPGINIKRNPLCGRNFEYYSEDPLLAGVLGASWISGIQSVGVGASLKHYAANNQETYRFNMDSIIDERALREIYLRNFQIALLSKPATIMSSYNKLNGEYVGESKYLLTEILRDEWNYRGVVVSDWGAVSNRVKSLKAGLDLEMPASYGYNSSKLKVAYVNKEISEEEIDRSVSRIANLVNKYSKETSSFENPVISSRIATTVANEGIVLLKNDNILPIKARDKVAIVGEYARNPRVQGGGSSNINPYKLENIVHEITSYTKYFKYFPGYNLKKNSFDKNLLNDVISNIKDYDKIVVIVGLPEEYENEGLDRETFDLPFGQVNLINEISKINPNVIVCLYTGSQVALPFKDKVKGIINCHLLGQVAARPLLDIIYGIVNPSGRLATTYPISIDDDPSTKNFGNSNNAVYYEESIYVGYRYYTTYNKEVNYPFGYGLSYTEFSYTNLTVSNHEISKDCKIDVSVNVKNIGRMAGKVVVMLFVENVKSEVHKPLRELRNYQKIFLDVNEEKKVTFQLDYNDFSYYDVNMAKFHVNKSDYKIQICSDASTVILEELVTKKYNDLGYEVPAKATYEINQNDFEEAYGRKLPPKNITRRRPYTLDDTVSDVGKTLIGRVLQRKLYKEIKKMTKGESSAWYNQMYAIALATPLRSVATMSGGVISLKQMEGIVDIINFKLLKGIRKL